GQGAADARVIERLALVIYRQDAAAIPVAGLHCDLIAERADQLVAHRRRKATKLDRRAVAADGLDPGDLLGGVDADKPVKIGQSLMVVIGIALALDRLTGVVGDEFERPRAFDVLLVPMDVLVEFRLAVDP